MNPVLWMLVETVGSLLAAACMLRVYAWRVHLNPGNPLSQFMRALTEWLVSPIGKVVKASRGMDWPSLVAALLIAALTALLFFVLSGQPIDPLRLLIMAVLWLVRWTLYLAMGLIVLMALISMINPYAPLAPALNQLTAPVLAPFRKFIPLVGSFDLSPLAALLVIQLLLAILPR